LRIRRLLRRLGCGILLVLWFTFLLTPCLMIKLAVDGEIVLTHSDIPNDDFRVWLIQDVRNRGIAVSNTRRVDAPSGAVCTLTDVGFFLWQGKGGDSQHYCSCYSKVESAWSSVAEGDSACQLAGEQK
jgi:hypothetical protein